MIPDFILKPIVAQQRDSRWEVLDLKLPQVKLLAGKGSRAKLSSKVMDAIRQLRDYKEHFEDPAHAREIDSVLGHALKKPKLGVLIPGCHLELPHPWPGQTPPVDNGGTTG